MYNLIYWWARLFLRLYFRRTIVYGRERLPLKGPLIVASNHPSAFMEASVLATVIGRPLHFLVRGDVFNPKFRWLFNWTNQIPIYRQKDGISNLRKNASSFELTYKKLAEGNAVLIFPEAKTTLEKKMRPIQRGTAHLAFGTLPFLKEGDALTVIPVGVNFMNPRIPGTDVVIRFGKPFVTGHGTREDRDAIEEFTAQLSDSLSPLIIQIPVTADEVKYDALASVYMTRIRPPRDKNAVHDDLVKIAAVIDQPYTHHELKNQLQIYLKQLEKIKLSEVLYFPSLWLMNRAELGILFLLKLIWFLAGGWIWRMTRHFIYSKLRTDTFQGPSSVGAAMVLFPLLSLIFMIVCLTAGWSAWWIPVWWILLALGKFIPYPISMIWKLLKIQEEYRRTAKKSIHELSNDLEKIVSG